MCCNKDQHSQKKKKKKKHQQAIREGGGEGEGREGGGGEERGRRRGEGRGRKLSVFPYPLCFCAIFLRMVVALCVYTTYCSLAAPVPTSLEPETFIFLHCPFRSRLGNNSCCWKSLSPRHPFWVLYQAYTSVNNPLEMSLSVTI